MLTETYNLGKAFGPVATITGYVIFAAGVLQLLFSISGLILVVIGAFIGFSYSATTIDFKNRKVRFTNILFGFIKTGKWYDITKDMHIGIKSKNNVYRTYNSSNLYLDISQKQVYLHLLNAQGKPIFPLKNTSGNPEKERENLSNRLGLSLSNSFQPYQPY
jgi:hypothetical protein